MPSSFPMAESRPGARPVAARRFQNGSLGVFWFLGSEFTVFTGLAIIFLAGRKPEWSVQKQDLGTGLAAVGTLALVASCCTLARAYMLARADTRARRGDASRIRPWIGATLTLGLAFLVCSGAELAGALAHGHGVGTSGYWAHWFLLTGMHASRVLAGVVALTIVMARRGAQRHVGTLGLYWLFVCLVWFAYFPMLYVAG